MSVLCHRSYSIAFYVAVCYSPFTLRQPDAAKLCLSYAFRPRKVAVKVRCVSVVSFYHGQLSWLVRQDGHGI